MYQLSSYVTFIHLTSKTDTQESASTAATGVCDTSQCFPISPQLYAVFKAVYYKHVYFQVWGKTQIEQNVLCEVLHIML